MGDLEGVATHRLDVRDGDAAMAFSAAASTSNALFNWSVFARKCTILECDEDAISFSGDLNIRAM
jgi:hypothetical protein